MKFTLSWLKTHLDTQADLATITDKLTALGLEVDSVEDRAKGLDGFTVGYVKSAVKHPDADKLRLCIVETKFGDVQVVCGAPNARTGMKGVFAPAGSVIPGTGVELKKGVIRGVESNGMLCSMREMGLGQDHDGIIDLPEDAEIGTPFAAVLGLDDPLIEIGLTPDRADCTGVRGIARDLAAAGLGTLKPLAYAPVEGTLGASPIGIALHFAPGTESACPHFVGRYFTGLKNGPSPAWLQERLRSIGLRPISALVDITNFITFDLGRPAHVFDAAKLQGPLTLRLSQAGESLLALDGKTYVFDDQMTLVTDQNGPLSVGGIIGGEATGVSEHTTEAFLEIAYFDPVRIALTGRKLGVISDARYRLERGVDPEFLHQGAEIASRLILDICGGEASYLAEAGHAPDTKRTYTLRPSRCLTLGGLDVPADRQEKILTDLGFVVSTGTDGLMQVTPPSWRGDVQGEPDLVEEVLRVVGFDHVPATPLKTTAPLSGPAVEPRQRRAVITKRLLAGRGMLEAVTWSFMKTAHAELFRAIPESLKLLNPISADLDAMRPTPLGNLISAAARNADRGYADVALFEVGPQFETASPEGQKTVAAGIRAGVAVPRNWAGPSRSVDAFDAKADVLAVLETIGAPVDKAQLTLDAPAYYHPGRSAVLRLGPTILAQFGEIHPSVLKGLDAKGPLVAFEIFLDTIPLPRTRTLTRPLLKPAAFQPLTRDFAFLVDAAVATEKLTRAARAADKALIIDAQVFDIYVGKGVEDGKKSVALSITLQPAQAALTEQQIQAIADKVVANVSKQTGGVLRG